MILKCKLCLLVTLFIGTSSCNNTENKGKAEEKEKQEKPSDTHIENLSTDNNGIVGKWKLELEAVDENENKILDEEERKKGFKNTYYYQFKSDGTCIIFQTQKGHYEIKETDGKKKLYTFIDEGEGEGPEAQYIINSIDDNEMVLLEGMGELTFWIFKREK